MIKDIIALIILAAGMTTITYMPMLKEKTAETAWGITFAVTAIAWIILK